MSIRAQGDAPTVDAQAAVIGLGARYCAYIDGGDWESLISLFAPDAVFRIGERSVHGAVDLEDFFRKAVRGIHLAGLPFVTSPSASVFQSVQNFLFVADGNSTVTRGRYIDRIHQSQNEFVFAERIVELHPSAAPTQAD